MFLVRTILSLYGCYNIYAKSVDWFKKFKLHYVFIGNIFVFYIYFYLGSIYIFIYLFIYFLEKNFNFIVGK